MNADRQMDDAERLTRWVRDHGQAVHGFLLAMVRDRTLADDLLQEVFCRAWEARSRYTDLGKERGYLLRIADRLARDHSRRRRHECKLDSDAWRAVEPTGDEVSPLESITGVETAKQLQEALSQLSESQRRTLLLRYYSDLGFEEIARTLGCPLNTVLSHCRRGLETLRRYLVKDCV